LKIEYKNQISTDKLYKHGVTKDWHCRSYRCTQHITKYQSLDCDHYMTTVTSTCTGSRIQNAPYTKWTMQTLKGILTTKIYHLFNFLHTFEKHLSLVTITLVSSQTYYKAINHL